jgi:hypothetical protein
MASALFAFIQQLQDDRPWGAALDAGAGMASTTWLASLETARWTAITAASEHAAQIRSAVASQVRPQDRLLVGNWMDDALLSGETFDTVLADYLLGAVEAFGPYFQRRLFARLRRHVAGRLYVVGLDPYIVGPATTAAEKMVRAVGRLRDSCLLLADETPYREFPAEWAVNALTASGYRVVSARRFPNRYRPGWVNSQLDMGLRRLGALDDPRLAAALRARAEDLRTEALALCAEEEGLRCGHDYVIACEPG